MGTIPICAECLFKRLHKDWIDVHTSDCICFDVFFSLLCCLEEGERIYHTLQSLKLIVDELYSLAIKREEADAAPLAQSISSVCLNGIRATVLQVYLPHKKL